MSEPEMTTEFWVHCGTCAHAWIAAYVPMELGVFARVLKGVHCPKCGASPTRVFCGRGEP